MDLLNCKRCGHDWYQRKPGKPRNCAKCKVLYWDRPARIPKSHNNPGPVGRPMKYPIDLLEVGQSIILPWEPLPDGSYNQSKMNAIRNYSRKTGKKFWTESTP